MKRFGGEFNLIIQSKREGATNDLIKKVEDLFRKIDTTIKTAIASEKIFRNC